MIFVILELNLLKLPEFPLRNCFIIARSKKKIETIIPY